MMTLLMRIVIREATHMDKRIIQILVTSPMVPPKKLTMIQGTMLMRLT
jgi:hypothetical protein